MYDLFWYRKNSLTCLYIKQVYSRYAYIELRENLRVTIEAQLIFNKFWVDKTLCIPVKIIIKKENILKSESRMFIFS